MSKLNRLVHGIGFNSGKFPASFENRSLKEYSQWANMLRRCGNDFLITRPTYYGVTCSDNFKDYSFFYEWCNRQVGFKNKDSKGKSWQLDKDLLVKGNKVYSEDVCVFVPHRINCLLINKELHRGEYPVGVYKDKRPSMVNSGYRARCSIGSSKCIDIGMSDTVEGAFAIYKAFKESLIKQVANEYRTQLDPRAYQALMNYQVEITD